jgi:uncharacterized protein DUF6455
LTCIKVILPDIPQTESCHKTTRPKEASSVQDKSRLKLHAALLDRMATAQGVDLQEAALSGRLSIDDISDAVLNCVDCPDPTACQGWLERQSGTAPATPGYCRNADLLRDLR